MRTLTETQIADLIALVRMDSTLWEILKDRELEAEKAVMDAARQGLHVDDPKAVLDPPKQPTMVEILTNIARQKCGSDDDLFFGPFVMAVRKLLREELGII